MYVSEINEDISEIHEFEIPEEILEIPILIVDHSLGERIRSCSFYGVTFVHFCTLFREEPCQIGFRDLGTFY